MFQFRKCIYTPVLLLLLQAATLFANPSKLEKSWSLFLHNQVDSALTSFQSLAKSADVSTAAEACRALVAVSMYLRNYEKAVIWQTKAYALNPDLALLCSQLSPLMSWRVQQNKNIDKVVLKTITKISNKTGLFSGTYGGFLVQKYLNTGQLKKAHKASERLGAIRTWRFIGPFDNTSNFGFYNPYPPEKEFQFDKTYKGKSGIDVRWMPLYNNTPDPWIFLENHSTHSNAIYYFYTAIKADNNQPGILSFGSSGSFKVFFNGKALMQDSIFRNTGIDMFMAPVRIQKGDNVILLKLGHESKLSNFSMRLLNNDYTPISRAQFHIKPVAMPTIPGSIPPLRLTSRIKDSVEARLLARYNKNHKDYGALISLIDFYNVSEYTALAQQLITKALDLHPNSSLLYGKLAECFSRAKKQTQHEIAIDKAFKLDPNNFYAWQNSLQNVINEGNADRILGFVKDSPNRYKENVMSLHAQIIAYLGQEKEADIYKILKVFESNHNQNALALEYLYKSKVGQGELKTAAKLLKQYIKSHRRSQTHYQALSDLYLKSGKAEKALAVFKRAAKYDPMNPNNHYYSAVILYGQKKYAQALAEVNKCFKLVRGSKNSYNLKGNILKSQKKSEAALKNYRQAVLHTTNNFSAWSNIFSLTGQHKLMERTPLPDIDSLITANKTWIQKHPTRSALLAYQRDIYYYPSQCSKTRTFMLVHLPNQNEIDRWKEYQIPLNPAYQTFNIDKAYSRKANGSLIKADQNKNQLVFKSLEAGDFILLEYTLYNYYPGKMARHIYGEWLFKISIPTKINKLRFITPASDTIPYRVYGPDINVRKSVSDKFRITEFSASYPWKRTEAGFYPTDYPEYPKVTYSTFQNWHEIASWYLELTYHKQLPTLELKALADSLIEGAASPKDIIECVFNYIASNITYSYVPFRQSGWIPQAAKNTLATKIGDCKDMSVLAKSLLDIAGVPSDLVLVNSDERYYIDHAFIGPNFNHCILSYVLDGKRHFIDFTTKFAHVDVLPGSIQGTMALIIHPETKHIITLPIDQPQDRSISRTLYVTLNENGEMVRKVNTIRTGTKAAAFRRWNRFKSEEQRIAELKEILVRDYPAASSPKIAYNNIDTLTDSLTYSYEISADNVLQKIGNTYIFNVHIPDILISDDVPTDIDREQPVDLSYSGFSLSVQQSETTIDFPGKWILDGSPKNVKIQTDHINYELSYHLKEGKLIIRRIARFNYRNMLDPKVFGPELDALKKVIAADNVRLIFKSK